jgi:hypothetical protein
MTGDLLRGISKSSRVDSSMSGQLKKAAGVVSQQGNKVLDHSCYRMKILMMPSIPHRVFNDSSG